MYEFLKKQKLKTRLTFGYLMMIVLMVLLAVASIAGMSILYGTVVDFVNGSNTADTAVKICRIDVNIAARNVREMVLNDDISAYEGYKTRVEECAAEIDEELAKLKGTELLDAELYERYETALHSWEETGFAIIDMIEAGDRQGAMNEIFVSCVPKLDTVIEIGKEIDTITDGLMQRSINTARNAFIICVALIVIFIVTSILLGRRIGSVSIRTVTEPLGEVEKVAQELSEGNLHSQLEYHSDDEIGHLAHSLRKSIRILASYVDDIDEAMKKFSQGNFVVEPSVEWKGDFEGILEAFKMFEGSMADTVHNIHSVADQVKNGADQVSASSMDLAQGATDQASITQELAATIESVSEQVSRNAETAKNISSQVAEVGVEIESGNEKMKEMVQSMAEISEASNEIGKIIATINDIASQTNLLALNASIEAARAGEAGKGFAVVADQVSVLAAQSADAAKESTLLIESSVRAVEKGMVIADDTAKQLEQVVSGAKAATEDVGKVAEALEAQEEAFEQINSGVDHINDVVQTNSATSQECAAASEEMTSQASMLEELIGRFQVRE